MAGEKDTYFDDKRSENQFQGESYNLLGTLGAAMPSAILGVMAVIKSNEAKNDLKKQQTRVDSLMKNYMSTPIYNPYDNLSVANKANEIKMQETDKALANTLDTLRAQGASAGGATALAQAALKSKAGIAADIEKQEVGNEKLKAQGEIMVQNAEMQRKGQFMDYEQSKADQLRTEQFGYGERAADMAGALGSLGLQASRGLGSNNQQGQSQVKRDQSLIDSQIATGNQVTSGVDVDALTRSEPQDFNSDIDIIVDQPTIEDLGNVGAVTGSQAMSAFPGKGLMNVDQSVPVGQSNLDQGYVTIDGEKVPYGDLQDSPGGVGKIMKRKIQ
mgnify:CR=1 FL=1|tara:strand:- start:4669 stop:5658 length:990 start_codon:yes stop_codon:yes gene_type:complete